MKTNSWLRVGLVTLIALTATPMVAQRKKATKRQTPKATVVAKNKAGHYLILGTAPSAANGKWVYLTVNGKDALDSVMIKGGKFSIERPVVQEHLQAALHVPREYYLSLIPEEGTIIAPMDENAATGTPLNDLSAKLREEDEAFVKPYTDRLKAIRMDEKLSADEKEKAQDAIIEELYGKLEPRYTARLAEHPNDAIGFMALRDLLGSTTMDLAKAESCVAQAQPLVRNQADIQKMLESLRQREATKPGMPFVDFTGVDDSNKAVRLSDYVGKGHYVLVDFWASWCGPCRREIAHLKKVRDAYTDKGLVILGAVVWDEMEAHLKAMKELEITWPQILNKDEPTNLYGIQGIPQIILFAPDGKIVARDLRGKAINDKLDEILKTTEGKL